MKLTKIRQNGQKIDSTLITNIVRDLKQKIESLGFITEVSEVNSQSIKIGLRMRSFSVDVNIHGRNLQRNPYASKLTNLPTWDQRVKFNDAVNYVLDAHNISGKVVSGPYTIRDGETSMTEGDWYDQKPDWVYSNESNGYIVESVNEKQYLEDKKRQRKLNALRKRIENKMKTEGVSK